MLCQQERLRIACTELRNFINEYWYASPENEGCTPLEINYDLYQTYEDNGMLLVYTGRDEKIGRIIACAVYIVIMSPKHRNHAVADCDTLAVKRELRGQGLGRALYQFAEAKLIEQGVDEIIHRSRNVYDAEPLFPKLGFTHVENVFSKKVT